MTESSGDQGVVAAIDAALKKVAERHNLGYAGVNAARQDGALFCHFALHDKAPEESYARWYLNMASALCLEPSWLNATIQHPRTRERMVVLGLDPDGGDTCIRVRKESGIEGFITPDSLRKAMQGG